MAGDQMNGDNWSVAGDWENGIPTAGDNAIFPKSNGNAVIIDTSPAADGIDLALLATMPGFRGDVGTVGTAIEGSTAKLHVMGTGNFYWKCAANDGSAFDCNEARIEPDSATAVIHLGGQAADAGEFDLCEILSGLTTYLAGIAFKSDHVTLISRNGNLTVANGVAAIPKVELMAGNAKLDNVIDELVVDGGKCIKDLAKASLITVSGTGVVEYNHSAVAGNVVRVVLKKGGTFDLTKTGGKKVIDQLIEYDGSRLRYDKDLHTITSHIRVSEAVRAA